MRVSPFLALIALLYTGAVINETYRGNGRLAIIYLCYGIASFVLGLQK